MCVSLVSHVREDIIDGDFSCCMENLQRSSKRVKDIKSLLTKANEICTKYGKHEFNYTGNDEILMKYSAYMGKHI